MSGGPWLLDINVLIALIDPTHVHHNPAHAWFANAREDGWATCPMTENGVVRIVGHPRYPNAPGGPSVVVEVMRGLRAVAGHAFWPDDISLLDAAHVDAAGLLAAEQVTDTYLLALATARGGRLATFDRRLSARAIPGGAAALHIV